MNWRKIVWIGLAVALALIQLTLIAAKLTGRISCSWWWILTPLWSPLACVAMVAVLGIAFLAHESSNGGNPFR
jgi:hypothetical protein